MDYMDYNARKQGLPTAPELTPIPPADDQMATTIRMAIDARKLGYAPDQIDRLIRDRRGIEVTEHRLPTGDAHSVSADGLDELAQWKLITL